MDESAEKRPQFGSRFLTDEDKVFEHNAWDNVDWDPELVEAAKEKISKNSAEFLSDGDQERYEKEAGQFWNVFYNQHQNKFFKDRHWLFTEFPELAQKHCNAEKQPEGETPQKQTGLDNPNYQLKTRILEDIVALKLTVWRKFVAWWGQHFIFSREVGCGVGNTVFPILQTNNDKNLFVYCCDFAESAIEIVKKHPLYDPSRCHSFVCDVAADEPNFPCSPESLDIIVMIFVLSAIHPDRMAIAIKSLVKLLKPGGVLLFRDYGRYDMAQLRFKPGRCLSENFYVRGDGTRVYFFTQEEIHDLFTTYGLTKEQNIVDKRLQVNRGKQLKMYRVWIQCKYRKENPKETLK